ncbi:MAG: pantetheine-phosphate adenylyltransferase [Planctomycetota bacterium]|nr:MAG: pantetheine-phosphate adenylyltransferase [Planctomycetota bacterium]
MRACYPGSFDPPTLGHDDIIRRAQGMVDELVIAIGRHPEKKSLLSVEQRLAVLQACYRDLPGIRVVAYEDTTVHFARKIGTQVLIRGLRSYADFESERGMAEVNRANGFDTIFLLASPVHTALSSSLVRQVLAAGLPLDGLVAEPVAQALQQSPTDTA